ncbi:MAG: hypothetical protein K2X01_00745 [Cyanobacteria bacterium]|nr:hypothetical protein [Cyanobacteriota bacterium]
MSVGLNAAYAFGMPLSAGNNQNNISGGVSGVNNTGNVSTQPNQADNRAENPKKSEPKIAVTAGHGSGCGHCVGMNSGLVSPAKLETLKAERYSAIMSHEQAHASAAGGFGGGIHIDYDSNGIAIGGHVPISIPGLDRANPETSLAAYHTIRSAALAPSDPSGQDMSVAARADSLIGRAQEAISQKADKALKPDKPDRPDNRHKPATKKPFSVTA